MLLLALGAPDCMGKCQSTWAGFVFLAIFVLIFVIIPLLVLRKRQD